MARSDKTYGQKPIYYGSAKSSPIYYGASRGASPVYYGGGGQTPYYYGGQAGAQNDDSLVGTITPARILRVIQQRWISVLVFLLIGLVGAFAVYRISPTIYEATSEFTIDIRRKQNHGNEVGQVMDPDYGTSYAEIFNTRISDWRSEKLLNKIVQQYRADNPSSTVTDGELLGTLGGSRLSLGRLSRLITISVRSKTPALAASLANAYASAIDAFTEEENRLRCDKAVAQIHEIVEKHRRQDEKISKILLDFSRDNKIVMLTNEREILQKSLNKTTSDILELETRITTAVEWEKVLEAAQETPEDFGALPQSVPRSAEISQAYTAMQNAQLALAAMLSRFTRNHPDVRSKEKELEAMKLNFKEAVARALATAHGNVSAFRNQLAVFRANSAKLRAQLAEIEEKIVFVSSSIKKYEQEQEVSSALYTDLLRRENEARMAAEQNNEIVRLGRPASVPSVPVLPDPMLIFSAGAALSLVAGLLFVLILDHLEDTIVSLSDIENRLSLKVLAVLPHVRKKKREDVAKFVSENKYSQFAEAVAGLRNLLDSPRYQSMSQVLLVMSTQPGEGKTITSCSLAQSSAQAGKRTLLVDFDLRRPRLAHVWGVKIHAEQSFSHTLSKNEKVDFSKIVQPSGLDNLDVLVSLRPDNVNPASIMGSKVVPDFFDWAREHYDRVIVDSPPFGIVGDVVTLASLVDSVIIMCCPDRTHFRPIQHASRVLMESGATIIGVVVNDVEMGGAGGAAFAQSGHSNYGYKSRYGYGYGYYGYGYGPGKDEKDPADADADAAEAAESGTAGAEGTGKDSGGEHKHHHHRRHDHVMSDPEVADEA